jgi:hypothetical protein
MRSMLLVAAALAMVGLVGCGSGTTGGPGADKKEKSKLEKAEDMVRQGEDTFSLTVPVLSTKLKQGESKEVVIGINRGKNFDEDVVLVFDELPQGVTVDPASPTIKHGDENAKVTVKTKDDAAIGDHTLKLKGKPAKGKEATNEVKVSVAKK